MSAFLFDCLSGSPEFGDGELSSPGTHILRIHANTIMYKTRNILLKLIPKNSLKFYSSNSAFGAKGPSPLPLDPEDQKEFEQLQQAANTQIAIEQYNEDHGFSPEDAPPKITSSDVGNFGGISKTIPEFEGNVNPKTGEVNGPKQDPIKHGDWSFNGRATDF